MPEKIHLGSRQEHTAADQLPKDPARSPFNAQCLELSREMCNDWSYSERCAITVGPIKNETLIGDRSLTLIGEG